MNRIECRGLPDHIFSVEDDPSVADELATSNSYKGRRLSFHAIDGPARLFGKGVSKAMKLTGALEHGIESLGLTPKDIRAIVVELTRKALHAHLRSKGLVERGRVNRGPIYFFNSTTVPDAKIAVKLPENSKRSTRNLWGKHKDIFWHLGIELIVSAPEGLVVTLSPHVHFTKDSIGEPLDYDATRDYRKQQVRRRAIARLWFNDKWRGFFYPFLAFVREGDGTIQVPFEGNTPLVFAGTLSTLKVPVTHVAVSELLPDDLISPTEDEDFDND